jgi:hypothetical protein
MMVNTGIEITTMGGDCDNDWLDHDSHHREVRMSLNIHHAPIVITISPVSPLLQAIVVVGLEPDSSDDSQPTGEILGNLGVGANGRIGLGLADRVCKWSSDFHLQPALNATVPPSEDLSSHEDAMISRALRRVTSQSRPAHRATRRIYDTAHMRISDRRHVTLKAGPRSSHQLTSKTDRSPEIKTLRFVTITAISTVLLRHAGTCPSDEGRPIMKVQQRFSLAEVVKRDPQLDFDAGDPELAAILSDVPALWRRPIVINLSASF